LSNPKGKPEIPRSLRSLGMTNKGNSEVHPRFAPFGMTNKGHPGIKGRALLPFGDAPSASLWMLRECDRFAQFDNS
jgi:hypothetical protein